MAKILVSVDDRLLVRIDRAARTAGVTRSAYLARLAAHDVGAERGPGSESRATRAIARLDELFKSRPPEDATAVVRAERDAR